MVDPPERQPEAESAAETQSKIEKKTGPKSSKDSKSWLKTDSARMIEIRSNQAKLIQSEMERNANNKKDSTTVEDIEPLNAGSTSAPWYVTKKQRKYYHLKSLDKSSFVFTRIKPKREMISQTEIKRAEDSDSETEVENSESLSNEPVTVTEMPLILPESSTFPLIENSISEIELTLSQTDNLVSEIELSAPRKRGRPRKVKPDIDLTDLDRAPKTRRVTRSAARAHVDA